MYLPLDWIVFGVVDEIVVARDVKIVVGFFVVWLVTALVVVELVVGVVLDFVVKKEVGFAVKNVELITDEIVVDGFVVVVGLAVVGIVNIVGDTFVVVVVNFVVCTVELEFVQFVQFQPAGHEVKH